jgi:hypothetical protein
VELPGRRESRRSRLRGDPYGLRPPLRPSGHPRAPPSPHPTPSSSRRSEPSRRRERRATPPASSSSPPASARPGSAPSTPTAPITAASCSSRIARRS